MPHFYAKDLMRGGRSNNIGFRCLPRSALGISSPGFRPSDTLINIINDLAKWRIDQSSIIFPECVCEFHGGNATVSQAFLRSHSSDDSRLRQFNLTSPMWTCAERTSHWELVAIKKFKIAEDTNFEKLLRSTFNEAKFLAELSHPNIVEFKGFLVDLANDIILLVFPWEGNGNLKDFLAKRPWKVPERIKLIGDVARGLEYLHEQDPPVCHGDLKSGNILVNSEYNAVITDFGSARRLFNDGHRLTKQSPRQTEPTPQLHATFSASTNTITLTGNKYTLRWAAPELLMEDDPRLPCDIWAFGWISYEAITNSLPFQDTLTDVQVVQRVIQGDLPSIAHDARISWFEDLFSLMTACWSTNSSARPQARACRNIVDAIALEDMTIFTRKSLEDAAPRALSVSEIRETIEKFHPWRIEAYLEVNKQSAAERDIRWILRNDPAFTHDLLYPGNWSITEAPVLRNVPPSFLSDLTKPMTEAEMREYLVRKDMGGLFVGFE